MSPHSPRPEPQPAPLPDAIGAGLAAATAHTPSQPGSTESPALSKGSAPQGLPWLVAGLISAVILAATVLAGGYVWQQAQARAEAQLQATAFGMAQRLADWHRERLAAATLLQHRDTLDQIWAQDQAQPGIERMELMSKLLHDYAHAPSIASIELFDSSLQSLWHSASQASPSHPTLSAGLQNVRAKGQAQVVGPWRDAQGRVQLAYVGLLDPPGFAPALVALHAQRPPYFHAALTQWPLEKHSGSARLFSIRDQQVHYWSDLPALASTPGPHDPAQTFAQRLLRGEIATGTLVHGPDDHGHPALAMLLPVEGTDWIVQVEADHTELMGWAHRALLGLGLTGTLALLLALGGTRLLLQRRQLASATQALAALERAQVRLRESEARYRLLAENANDVVWLFDLASERQLYVSPSIERLLGYDPQERTHLPLTAMFEPAVVAHIREVLRRHLERLAAGDASAQNIWIELSHRHKDGQAVPVEISARIVFDAQGRPAQVQGVSRDIRERRRAERQIRLLSQATAQSPAAVLITNAQGHIEYVNPAFERISGYSATEVQGQNPRLLQSNRTPSDTYRQMWQALLTGQVWQGELINTNKDGSHSHMAATIAPLRDPHGGQVVQYIAVQMDVTAQRDAEAQVELLAWFDPLTGLPNRQRLLADIGRALRHRNGNGEFAGLLILNLDRFKALNDALGRTQGDAVLLAVSERLRQQVQEPDVAAKELLAHLNGDEFALLMVDLGHDASLAAAALMRRASDLHRLFEQTVVVGADALRLSLSIGVTLLDGIADERAAEALRRADTALHQAKDAGGNQSVFFDARMGQWVAERFALEQDLRRGIEAGELRLYLQPQVDALGRMVGAEALVRWQHPQRGLMGPVQFIGLAEESGLIEPLGQWVLEQACAWIGRLRALGRPLPISVNISPHQFHQTDFSLRLQQVLQRHAASGDDLMLEFTESVVLRQVEQVIERMGFLSGLGVRFSIDDFGTGYSSLSYLKTLPIHELKIDRSFVQDAPNNPGDAALVAAMLSVASLMQLRVVAEGVETDEQAAIFRLHPGALMQGYLFGRPEPAEALIGRWLAEEGQGA
ncbi:putative bifunctional diguanylate cyclase/phosphodiesterase [Serpentinimonas barnesii]|uniref:putative bifunctional diguanylate cyclase/phosphodiesterase n=1 Tax=Serpentinimonas barnesii TaxID=1458427 RepID=UPI00069382E9|nr:EAL domain-containing protein [Serpentinimonas barnesii]